MLSKREGRTVVTLLIASFLLFSLISSTMMVIGVETDSTFPESIPDLETTVTIINGDWNVTGDQTNESEVILLTGNLTIEFGGNLTFNNVTLMINSSVDGEYHIEVKQGGTFTVLDLDNDNTTTDDASNITANNTAFEYNFWVRDGSNFTMRNSEVHECGYNAAGFENDGLYINSDNVTLQRCLISYNRDKCMVIENSSPTIIECTFTNNEIWAIYNINNGNPSIKGCVMKNSDGGVYCQQWSEPIIENCTFYNIGIPGGGDPIATFLGSNPTIINTTIRDSYYGIVDNGGITSYATIINSTIENTTSFAISLSSAYFTLINTTFNKTNTNFWSLAANANLTLKQYLHTYINDTNGNPISNANVVVKNSTGSIIYDGFTDVNGYVKWITATEYVQFDLNGDNDGEDPGEKIFHTPHNITVTKPGYATGYVEVDMNESKTVIITLQDIESPELNHTPVTSAKVNEQIDITVNATDNTGVGNVTLYYQNVGDLNYTPLNMTLSSGDSQSGDWSATIPVQTETGIVHYFIWANDTSGNNITSPIMGDYAIRITGPPSIKISNPVGEEDWTGGSNHLIEFTASDTEDIPADLDVFLNYTSLSAGNGTIASIKGDESPYLWALPTIDAIDVSINATVIDTGGNKAYDDSAIFEIDSTPPGISSTGPANNTTGISLFQPIVIQFDEQMNISSVVVNQTNGTNPSGWNWYWNEEKDTITGIHDAWPRGENVEITVQAGYRDDSDPGNVNNTAYVFSFTTETNPPPEVIHTNATSPQELGDEIRINATITDDGSVMNAVLWWQGVDDVWHENYMDKDGTSWEYLIPGQMMEGTVRYQINATDDLGQKSTTIIYEFDIEDSIAPIIAHTPLENVVEGVLINITCQIIDIGGVNASSVYLEYWQLGSDVIHFQIMNPGFWYELQPQPAFETIEYRIYASDIYGNGVTTQLYTLVIVDTSIPDTTPPEVLFAEPTGNNVLVTTNISIVFSETMNQTSVENAISISPDISFSNSWTNDQTLILSIANDLLHNTTYTITIDTGAKDLAENTLMNDYSWQFTTTEEPEIIQPLASNDWGWIVIIIILVTIIMLMSFYLFSRGRKEKETEEEPL